MGTSGAPDLVLVQKWYVTKKNERGKERVESNDE